MPSRSRGGDWVEQRAAVTVDKPVRLDLELPPSIHAEDRVAGRLRLVTASGRFRVRLQRDGEPVSLLLADGVELGELDEQPSAPLELRFEAGPGTYTAVLEAPESGEGDAVEKHVGEPGRFRSLVRQLALVQPGDPTARRP